MLRYLFSTVAIAAVLQGTPTIAQAFDLTNLQAQARQMTVRIRAQEEPGSGVIIARQGKTYTILTAQHVIGKVTGEEIEVYTHDGHKYLAQTQLTKQAIFPQAVDLAVLQFESDRTYPVATLSEYQYPLYENRDYQPRDQQRSELQRQQRDRHQHYVFTAGYPNVDLNNFAGIQAFVLTSGLLADSSATAISNPQARYASYEMVYSNMTYPGMSGGPVFDPNGRVIAIHGRSDGKSLGPDNQVEEQYLQESGNNSRVRLGMSLGVPSKTFLRLSNNAIRNLGLKIESSAPSKVNRVSTNWRPPNPFAKAKNYDRNPFYWLEEGNQLWRLGKFQDAQASFDRARQANEQLQHYAWFAKGFTAGFEQNYPDALTYCQRSITSHPNPSHFYDGYRCKAAALLYLQNYPGALEALSQAIQIQTKQIQVKPGTSQNPSDYAVMAELLFAQKQYRGALVKLDEAIQLRQQQYLGDSATIRNSRAMVLMSLERYEEALQDCDRSLALQPNYSTAWVTKGLIYKRMQQFQAAIAAYDRAVQLDPQDANAWNNRGNTLFEMQKYPEALQSFERAIAADPNNYNAKQNYADLMQFMRDNK
ncbi:MAG: tetratricopeptide repeat-containing serine protease family protein [Synechococcales bacterium]|nr:tetratricopeptide repeat-containing serine protease family protein [Synechococcales bacterium]